MPRDTEALLGVLSSWLPAQRWYAGKGRDVAGHSVESDAELASTGDAVLRHVVVRVDYKTGPSAHYQLLLGERTELPHRLEHAQLGEVDGVAVYDAVHDHGLTAPLLDRLAAGSAVGDLRFGRRGDSVIDPSPTIP